MSNWLLLANRRRVYSVLLTLVRLTCSCFIIYCWSTNTIYVGEPTSLCPLRRQNIYLVDSRGGGMLRPTSLAIIQPGKNGNVVMRLYLLATIC
ncbi:hypothetical protein GJ744_011458 [Endocarpon pusillum]|uniref:Uncharacterized protein n=1 Tax=Endocarpon pusillum TaxID=364733 RepID=A0A8H7AG08_9EURO|nr:hypothetical protein GJ744_011458 [Endocarpon pusillum]